ncbi:MAG: PqqD family protein [Clostridiales bacterium]|nr:PqqD family protein [Clostridiales bacterium]
MKTRDGFILRKVAGKNVVVAIGPASKKLNGMIRLNETGAFCWDFLLKGTSEEELLEALLSEYSVSKDQAEEDLKGFLDTLREAGCLEED